MRDGVSIRLAAFEFKQVDHGILAEIVKVSRGNFSTPAGTIAEHQQLRGKITEHDNEKHDDPGNYCHHQKYAERNQECPSDALLPLLLVGLSRLRPLFQLILHASPHHMIPVVRSIVSTMDSEFD
ncbi:hypothetical protein [Mesorhizobium amorphae]